MKEGMVKCLISRRKVRASVYAKQKLYLGIDILYPKVVRHTALLHLSPSVPVHHNYRLVTGHERCVGCPVDKSVGFKDVLRKHKMLVIASGAGVL